MGPDPAKVLGLFVFRSSLLFCSVRQRLSIQNTMHSLSKDQPFQEMWGLEGRSQGSCGRCISVAISSVDKVTMTPVPSSVHHTQAIVTQPSFPGWNTGWQLPRCCIWLTFLYMKFLLKLTVLVFSCISLDSPVQDIETLEQEEPPNMSKF